jgi:hypothetical protein
MAKRPKARRPQIHGQLDNKLVELADDLKEFEEFKISILPVLRDMVTAKAPPAEILEMVQSLAAAKLGTMIVRSDGKNTLAAIKEVLDRTQGKATEKIEQTHKFENMKEEQLDALLKSKLGSLNKDVAKKDPKAH